MWYVSSEYLSSWLGTINSKSLPVCEGKSLSRVRLFATPWTVAHQAPPSMRFSRKEYWSGLPFPSPGDLPDPGIEPRSPALQADALTSEPPGKPRMLSCFSRVWLSVTLCTCSPPGSSVHEILQERILEWVAIPFSRPRDRTWSPALQVDSLPFEPRLA